MRLPVDPERLRREFPALEDRDLDAWEVVTRRLLADPRRRGALLAELVAAAERARQKEASALALDEEERLGLDYLRAMAKMQPTRC